MTTCTGRSWPADLFNEPTPLALTADNVASLTDDDLEAEQNEALDGANLESAIQ